MDPLDYLRALRQRWRLVVACLVVALLAGWVTTPSDPTVVAQRGTSYSATATLLRDPASKVSLGYVALFVTKGEVPAIVAKKLKWPGDPAVLAATIEVDADEEVGTITIAASGGDGPRAARTANAFADEIIAYEDDRQQKDKQARVSLLEKNLRDTSAEIKTLESEIKGGNEDVLVKARRDALADRYGALYTQLQTEFTEGTSGAGLAVLQRATPLPVGSGPVFTAPSSRSGRLKLALVAGLLLGVALALLLDRFDTRLRRRAEVQEALGLPVLAEIPRLGRATRRLHPVFVAWLPTSPAAEAFRALRSSLMLLPSQPVGAGTTTAAVTQLSSGQAPTVILVVSAKPGEGKTTTAVNLAAVLAESGKRVLVLDCDFRGPRTHQMLDVPWGPGLSDLWDVGTHELLTLSRPTAVPNVRLVTAGTALDRPPALPAKLGELVQEARSLADVVVIDAPPMLTANESIDLMPYVDSVVVVVRSGRTTREQAHRSVELLRRMRVPVAGLVLNATSQPTSVPWERLTHRYTSGRQETSPAAQRTEG